MRGRAACQGCAVDWAPTDTQNAPTNGSVVTTPLPIKLLSLASPGLKPKGRVWRSDAPALTNGERLAWAENQINPATPGLETSACYPPKKHHQWIMATLPRPQQATASLGSDALAPPGSVISNRQAEPLSCRKDDLHGAYWSVRTLQEVSVQFTLQYICMS